MTGFLNRKVLPKNSGFQNVINSFKKMITMILSMKSDQISSQHTNEYFPLPWTNAKGFRVRPWDMPENCNFSVWFFTFNQLGKQREMKILYQNKWLLFISCFLQDYFCKILIYFFIILPIIISEYWTRMRNMAKRPQTFIRKPIVKMPFILLGKP